MGIERCIHNTTGAYNTAAGRSALLLILQVLTTGTANRLWGTSCVSAFGTTALRSNTTGANNTAVGRARIVF
jgi:hypothetical protein